jgi:hypothetical protein
MSTSYISSPPWRLHGLSGQLYFYVRSSDQNSLAFLISAMSYPFHPPSLDLPNILQIAVVSRYDLHQAAAVCNSILKANQDGGVREESEPVWSRLPFRDN